MAKVLLGKCTRYPGYVLGEEVTPISITKLLDRAWGSWELRALAGSIWLRMARSGCPWRPRWFDLAALCAPGRPNWLHLAALRAPGRPGWVDLVASECPNDCPIDTISKKKSILPAFDCFDAACFVRSGTFLSCLKSSIYIYIYI